MDGWVDAQTEESAPPVDEHCGTWGGVWMTSVMPVWEEHLIKGKDVSSVDRALQVERL